jgi:hypothetical protein
LKKKLKTIVSKVEKENREINNKLESALRML